jgi:hypothetical protein
LTQEVGAIVGGNRDGDFERCGGSRGHAGTRWAATLGGGKEKASRWCAWAVRSAHGVQALAPRS